MNKINPLGIPIITNTNNLLEDDILISFFPSSEKITLLANKKLLKIFHFTHFIMNTSLLAKNTENANIDYFLAENNLSKNSNFFKKYFPYYKKNVYVLPFVFQERFREVTSFNSRKKICVATGTIVKIDQMVDYKNVFREFIDYYKINTIHPMRVEIYKNKENLKNILDCYSGYLWDSSRKATEKEKNIFLKWYGRFFNAFVLAKRDYFKFDIVQAYNSYKMFVIPEEINDLPGIGFVEGMACGAAYIGRVDPMYADLGLKPGLHYIGYNGTLSDLKKKIMYYQKHAKELEKIADTGHKFVIEHFNGKRVAQLFFKDLEEFTMKQKNKKKNATLVSSFIKKI